MVTLFGRSLSASAALFLLIAEAGAQTIGPPVPQRIVPQQQRCSEQAQPTNSEEIVVCGQSPENSPYRVPPQFRNLPTDDDAEASWDARTRDAEAVERFSNQTIGGSGAMQRTAQDRCRWLAERQVAQGRRPDCGRRLRPDSDTDWQRR